MRLDDFDPDINVEDQRGRSFGGSGGLGGGMLLGLIPWVFSRFGCAGVAILLVVLAVFGGGLGMLGGGGSSTSQLGAPSQQVGSREAGGTNASTSCTVDASSKSACNAFSSADKTWAAMFQQNGQTFEQPKLVFYGGEGQSGCGAAQSAMGPFYCPTDQGIYLDTSFFQELSTRFGAKGDFAQDYVIAHEFGHHIQKLTGISEKVSEAQSRADKTEGNHLSVMLELQADCYAGVWANKNQARMDPGDVQEGMTAAHAIGDDTLQQEAQGRVVPDSFTHGTSAQRMQWLKKGLDTGDPAQCDTFQGALG